MDSLPQAHHTTSEDRLPQLAPEETKRLFSIARSAAMRIVGRYYPELLDDATQAAVLRAWTACDKGMNPRVQRWAAKMGALEVLRSRIGKRGHKATLYHAESLDGQYSNGATRDSDTRSELGAPDLQIEALFQNASVDTVRLMTRWVVDPRRRRMLNLYYKAETHPTCESPTFKDIGVLLGVSESRIYQFHREGCAQIRTELLPIFRSCGSVTEFFEHLENCRRCVRCRTIQLTTRFPRGPRALCVTCQDNRRLRRNANQRIRRTPVTEPKVLSPEKHTCRICERTLSVSCFCARQELKSGLCSYCQDCYATIRITQNGQVRGSYSQRIPFLRACWVVAWEFGLWPEYTRTQTEYYRHLKVSIVDPVHRNPGVALHLKKTFPYIPPEFIDGWLTTSPDTFNPKWWATHLGKSLDTPKRWARRLYLEAQQHLASHTET